MPGSLDSPIRHNVVPKSDTRLRFCKMCFHKSCSARHAPPAQFLRLARTRQAQFYQLLPTLQEYLLRSGTSTTRQTNEL